MVMHLDYFKFYLGIYPRKAGAACRNRTGDLFITNELLYQLS